MLRTLRLQSIGMAALALAVLGQGLLRADDVPAEQRLPPGVLGFFTIPDAVDFRDRFMASGLGQMIQDDSLAEFRDQFQEGWDEASQKMQDEVGVSASDLLALVDGEVTLAVLQPPGGSFGVLAMLNFGEHRETLDALLENAREGAEEEGATRTVETIQDTEVTIYKDESSEEGPNTVAYFIRDDNLVVSFSSNVDLLEDVLTRWEGDHSDTFAKDEIFAYIMQKCQPDGADNPQLKWYFSPIDLFRSIAMLPQANQGGISPAMALGFLPALGLDKFKAMGGTSSMMTDDYEGIGHTFLYVNQPTSGLVKFFECPAVRQEPPNWVPADVSAYSSVNWDVAGAYEAVESVVDFFQPPGTLANVVDQLAKQGPRIHIKDDVVDSLTGRFQMFGDVAGQEPADDEPAQQPGLFALELKNSDKIADVIQRVADISQGNLKSRDFRGTTIYEMDVPNFQGGPSQSLGIAVAKGQFFVAMNVEQLEEYLRLDEADEPLANSTDYRRISSHFPSETSYISFARPAAQLKPVYEQFRSGQMDALVEGIDFSTLPEFDKLADYFTTSGGYAIPEDKGALMVNFSLRQD